MLARFIEPVRRSIFLKLLLIFLIAAICGIAVIGVLVKHDDDEFAPKRAARDNLVQYVNYLVNDIGDPPDTRRAAELSASLGWEIRIESPGAQQAWASKPEAFEEIHSLDWRVVAGEPGARWARRHGHFFAVVEKEHARYVFSWGRSRFDDDHEHFVSMLFVTVGLILACAYVGVRWLFRPVKWLNQGVAQVSQGQLDVNIPVRKHDELGELADSFNRMTARLREMLRAKTQLLLDVSHELRSPMTRMKLALEFVDDGDAKRRLGDDLREMDIMVSEILESERLSSGKEALNLDTVDLCALLADAEVRYAEQAPGVRLAPCEPLSRRIDVRLVEIALRNVVENALKYSAFQSRPVELSVVQAGSAVQIRVRDHGNGIPEDERELIFEPFYRIDKSRHKDTGGYGLGLSLCRKIMQAHGGNIRVESNDGAGCTFVLEFA